MTSARLGLGLAALGRPAYINIGHGADLQGSTSVDSLEARCHEVLDAARAAGISYLDAARGYGQAEVFLKRWLDSRSIEPGEVTVASKWGYAYTANWDPNAEQHERKDHSAEHLQAQWAQSKALLWEYLDIYQIHSATLETGVLEDREVHRRLAELRDDRGLRLGLSLSSPRQAEALDRALEIEVGGQPLFEVVQATINLLERSVLPALARAKDAGWLVVVKEGLANGRLAGRDPSGRSPQLQEQLGKASGEHAIGRDALALAAVAHLPCVDIVLSGASTVAHLESNLEAQNVPEELARDLWSSTTPEEPESYWGFRKTLGWS